MAQTVKPVQLNPQTLEACDAYIHRAETEMEQTLHGSGPFFWSQQTSERAQEVDRGLVVAQFWSGQRAAQSAEGFDPRLDRCRVHS